MQGESLTFLTAILSLLDIGSLSRLSLPLGLWWLVIAWRFSFAKTSQTVANQRLTEWLGAAASKIYVAMANLATKPNPLPEERMQDLCLHPDPDTAETHSDPKPQALSDPRPWRLTRSNPSIKRGPNPAGSRNQQATPPTSENRFDTYRSTSENKSKHGVFPYAQPLRTSPIHLFSPGLPGEKQVIRLHAV